MRGLLIFVVILILSLATPLRSVANGTVPPYDRERILFLGDSLTSGLFASAENNTFASLVGAKRNALIARVHVTSLVQAAPKWHEISGWQPSVVVLEIGLNDVSRGQWQRGVWINDYKALVQQIQASGATVLLCTTFWAGIMPGHRNYAAYDGLNADVRTVASETGARLADLWTATLNCEDCVGRAEQWSVFAPYHGDNFHPSDKGHEVIADTIMRALEVVNYFPNIMNLASPDCANNQTAC